MNIFVGMSQEAEKKDSCFVELHRPQQREMSGELVQSYSSIQSRTPSSCAPGTKIKPGRFHRKLLTPRLQEGGDGEAEKTDEERVSCKWDQRAEEAGLGCLFKVLAPLLQSRSLSRTKQSPRVGVKTFSYEHNDLALVINENIRRINPVDIEDEARHYIAQGMAKFMVNPPLPTGLYLGK